MKINKINKEIPLTISHLHYHHQEKLRLDESYIYKVFFRCVLKPIRIRVETYFKHGYKVTFNYKDKKILLVYNKEEKL